ncbi:hypothetical protein CVT25_008566 [Psilocybe cyanescens]|uniref:Uncharacterized protein n=1 Tax=Psilocybe cyanescens TaxID=93625 RepID=A0A409XRM1_PSICY|nr:hypothetical protein CVT25_008566 [Psilocybe cyanescens]
MSGLKLIDPANIGKPFRHPVPARHVRHPISCTGQILPVKVFGFPFPDRMLDAWATYKGLFPNADLQNRCVLVTQIISMMIPWLSFCACDASLLWAVVKMPQEDCGMMSVLIVGTDETEEDLQHAYNQERIEAIRQILGDFEIEPAWYWRDHDFD